MKGKEEILEEHYLELLQNHLIAESSGDIVVCLFLWLGCGRRVDFLYNDLLCSSYIGLWTGYIIVQYALAHTLRYISVGLPNDLYCVTCQIIVRFQNLCCVSLSGISSHQVLGNVFCLFSLIKLTND